VALLLHIAIHGFPIVVAASWYNTHRLVSKSTAEQSLSEIVVEAPDLASESFKNKKN
jgi:hypothetical protein